MPSHILVSYIESNLNLSLKKGAKGKMLLKWGCNFFHSHPLLWLLRAREMRDDINSDYSDFVSVGLSFKVWRWGLAWILRVQCLLLLFLALLLTLFWCARHERCANVSTQLNTACSSCGLVLLPIAYYMPLHHLHVFSCHWLSLRCALSVAGDASWMLRGGFYGLVS